jgi:hypothetical protein
MILRSLAVLCAGASGGGATEGNGTGTDGAASFTGADVSGSWAIDLLNYNSSSAGNLSEAADETAVADAFAPPSAQTAGLDNGTLVATTVTFAFALPGDASVVASLSANATLYASFKYAYKSDLAGVLNITADRILVTSLAAGSIVVGTAIQADSHGGAIGASVVTTTLTSASLSLPKLAAGFASIPATYNAGAAMVSVPALHCAVCGDPNIHIILVAVLQVRLELTGCTGSEFAAPGNGSCARFYTQFTDTLSGRPTAGFMDAVSQSRLRVLATEADGSRVTNVYCEVLPRTGGQQDETAREQSLLDLTSKLAEGAHASTGLLSAGHAWRGMFGTAHTVRCRSRRTR